MANKHHIIWVEQRDTRKGWPEFREEAFRGALADAMETTSLLWPKGRVSS